MGPECEQLAYVSAKGIHLRRAWAPVSKTMPHGWSLRRPLEPRGPGLGILPGFSRGPGVLSRPGSAHAVP